MSSFSVIREMTVADAKAVTELADELGYPNGVSDIAERIATLLQSRDRTGYVACVSDAVVGWIEVATVSHLCTGSYGEITGLIVSSEHRSSGLGKELLCKAEQWVIAQGVSTVVVRSRTTRERAHRFYLREGYTSTKTSAVFAKQLA